MAGCQLEAQPEEEGSNDLRAGSTPADELSYIVEGMNLPPQDVETRISRGEKPIMVSKCDELRRFVSNESSCSVAVNELAGMIVSSVVGLTGIPLAEQFLGAFASDVKAEVLMFSSSRQNDVCLKERSGFEMSSGLFAMCRMQYVRKDTMRKSWICSGTATSACLHVEIKYGQAKNHLAKTICQEIVNERMDVTDLGVFKAWSLRETETPDQKNKSYYWRPRKWDMFFRGSQGKTAEVRLESWPSPKISLTCGIVVIQPGGDITQKELKQRFEIIKSSVPSHLLGIPGGFHWAELPSLTDLRKVLLDHKPRIVFVHVPDVSEVRSCWGMDTPETYQSVMKEMRRAEPEGWLGCCMSGEGADESHAWSMVESDDEFSLIACKSAPSGDAYSRFAQEFLKKFVIAANSSLSPGSGHLPDNDYAGRFREIFKDMRGWPDMQKRELFLCPPYQKSRAGLQVVEQKPGNLVYYIELDFKGVHDPQALAAARLQLEKQLRTHLKRESASVIEGCHIKFKKPGIPPKEPCPREILQKIEDSVRSWLDPSLQEKCFVCMTGWGSLLMALSSSAVMNLQDKLAKGEVLKLHLPTESGKCEEATVSAVLPGSQWFLHLLVPTIREKPLLELIFKVLVDAGFKLAPDASRDGPGVQRAVHDPPEGTPVDGQSLEDDGLFRGFAPVLNDRSRGRFRGFASVLQDEGLEGDIVVPAEQAAMHAMQGGGNEPPAAAFAGAASPHHWQLAARTAEQEPRAASAARAPSDAAGPAAAGQGAEAAAVGQDIQRAVAAFLMGDGTASEDEDDYEDEEVRRAAAAAAQSQAAYQWPAAQAAGEPEDDAPGTYRVISAGPLDALPVNKNCDISSAIVGEVAVQQEVSVLEVAANVTEGRRRARIADPAGWITLLNIGKDGIRFAMKQPDTQAVTYETFPPLA